jgi:hypothetical protein
MEPQDPVSEILNETNLGQTFLNRYSKDDLIRAILEMRKASASETLRLKELDYQLKLVEKEIELKRIEASVSGSTQIAEAVLRYADLVKDHDYGPMAVRSLSHSLSNIYTKFAPSTAPQAPLEPSATDLEDRIEVARAQGLRWNRSDKRPGRVKTLQKKLEEWETALSRGRSCEIEDFCDKDFDRIVADEGCEAFVYGLCERIEGMLGIQPPSKYLKVRYKKVAEMYRKASPSQPKVSQATTPLDIAKDLVQRLLGAPENLERRAKILSRFVEKNMADVRAMGPEALRAVVCNKYSPIVFEYDRDRQNCDAVEKYQSVKVHKKYDDKLQDFLDSYCDEKGL